MVVHVYYPNIENAETGGPWLVQDQLRLCSEFKAILGRKDTSFSCWLDLQHNQKAHIKLFWLAIPASSQSKVGKLLSQQMNEGWVWVWVDCPDWPQP